MTAGAGAAAGDGAAATVTVVGIMASDMTTRDSEVPLGLHPIRPLGAGEVHVTLHPLRPPGAGHVDRGACGRDAAERVGADGSGARMLCSAKPQRGSAALSSAAEASVAAVFVAGEAWLSLPAACAEPSSSANRGRTGEWMPLHAAAEVAASSTSRAAAGMIPLASPAPPMASAGVLAIAAQAASHANSGSTGAEARCCRDCGHAVCLARHRSCC